MKGNVKRTWCLLTAILLLAVGLDTVRSEEEPMESRLERVSRFFNAFSRETLDLADAFYDKDVVFRDPITDLKGLEALKAYYASMYENVISIRFDFTDGVETEDTVAAFWTMELRARGLRGGEPIRVVGASHIRFGGREGKVVYHRDYFDMGAFIYENVPVVGPVIRYIKGRFETQVHAGNEGD